jgi:gluconolactonase
MALKTFVVTALFMAGMSSTCPSFAAEDAYVAVDRPAVIKAIPGVVAASTKWEVVFSSVELQDGIIGTPDGGILTAMQQGDVIRKVAADGASTIFLGATKGAGALAMDNDGRVFAVHRKEPTFVSQLTPARRVIAPTSPDVKSLGRISDLVVDLKGGIYTTGETFRYINPSGEVTTLAPDIATNGIALSPDGKVLYVTNTTEVIAFDLPPDGMPKNQRVFAKLNDKNADGMAVDEAGRLYVPGLNGIHVFSAKGEELGLIPTPRRATSLAFSGRGKKTLYMLAVGTNKSDGTMLSNEEGGGQANGRTLYKLQMLAAGFKGRPK